MKTELVSLEQGTFFVRSWGDASKPTLLLLHGFPEYGGAWADLAPLLSTYFHCIAPDQRGYGQSWSPAGVENYQMSELVEDMAALIHHYGTDAIVMGHDWGAAVAYGLAIFRPDLVTRLIIANGVHPVPFQRALASGGAQTEASQYIRFLRRPDSHELLGADHCDKLVALFSADMDSSWLTGDRLEAYRTEWTRPGRLETMINWYRASPLRVATPGEPITDLSEPPAERLQIRCPHLLIWGEGDTALLPEATEGLEDFAADLTRVTVEGADHWLCHQNPQAVARHILDWTGAQT